MSLHAGQEVEQLVFGCSHYNLELSLRLCLPVESFRFLGSTISQGLNWASDINLIIKQAQQSIYFLCQLRKFKLPQELLIQFYSSAIIHFVLCTSITVCFGSMKQDYKKSLVPNCPQVRKHSGNVTVQQTHHTWTQPVQTSPLWQCYIALHTKTTRTVSFHSDEQFSQSYRV